MHSVSDPRRGGGDSPGLLDDKIFLINTLKYDNGVADHLAPSVLCGRGSGREPHTDMEVTRCADSLVSSLPS